MSGHSRGHHSKDFSLKKKDKKCFIDVTKLCVINERIGQMIIINTLKGTKTNVIF